MVSAQRGGGKALAEHAGERDRQREEKNRIAEKAQANRGGWRERQEQVHARELTVNDFGIGAMPSAAGCARTISWNWPNCTSRARASGRLSRLMRWISRLTPAARRTGPAAAEEEIAELRRKLSRLGSVNLEALQELDDLEVRAGDAANPVRRPDVGAAVVAGDHRQDQHDSRRLFSETFAAIRTHFQELFRKLFGGGMADIVLEDETDILESGIEIIARPPGKELRSISLMSGGEKTMTAVALLLAIFRSKPSPFCMLDEVDAALDEANIGRFTGVLREFLDRSQFIIITHSKRTMACADMLYGVTMQESGISRRIAVRFEDWPDDERETRTEAA